MSSSPLSWVVQTNKLATRQVLPFIQALQQSGLPFIDVGVDSETGLIHPLDPGIGKNLIPYGSTDMVRIAQKEGWKHLFFNDNTFRVDTWNDHHSRMLNDDAWIVTLSELKRILPELRQTGSWFVRPLHDLKAFGGHVDTAANLVGWIANLEKINCDIDGSFKVAVSDPKQIDMEWRYFVVDGKIVTGSAYRFKGHPHWKRELDADVLQEAQDLADEWLPHPCCVMDVAFSNQQVRVVEFNGLNASGFYDHDLVSLVKSVSEYCVRQE